MERWSSWFKAPVLKIGVRASVPWVRIPPSPPKALCLLKAKCFKNNWRHTQAGRRGQFAKLLGFARAARVRIPLSPPKILHQNSRVFFLCRKQKRFEPARATNVKKKLRWSFFRELTELAKQARSRMRSRRRIPLSPPKILHQNSRVFFFIQ